MGPTKREIPAPHGGNDKDLLSSGTRARVGVVDFVGSVFLFQYFHIFVCYLCTVNNK
jgi:hypothetical protein